MHTVQFASTISMNKQFKRKRNRKVIVRVLLQLLTPGDVHRVLAVRAIDLGALLTQLS